MNSFRVKNTCLCNCTNYICFVQNHLLQRRTTCCNTYITPLEGKEEHCKVSPYSELLWNQLLSISLKGLKEQAFSVEVLAENIWQFWRFLFSSVVPLMMLNRSDLIEKRWCYMHQSGSSNIFPNAMTVHGLFGHSKIIIKMFQYRCCYREKHEHIWKKMGFNNYRQSLWK